MKGLGKGLGALISENTIKNLEYSSNIDDTNEKIIEIDINKIQIDKNQPRKIFDEEKIEELANSIKTVGLISPIILKKKGDFFQIVSGERRFRAFKFLKLKKIPAIIRDYENQKRLEVALIENIQRENLNPIEEAIVYKKFQDDFNLSQDEIAEKVGKKRASISNCIRLLKLDERVQKFIIDYRISQGHAKALLSLSNKDTQFKIAKNIIEDNLSVRQTEEIVKKIIDEENTLNKKNNQANEKINQAKLQAFEEITKSLNEILGTKVKIKDKNNKGKIEIEYYSKEELERLIFLFKKI